MSLTASQNALLCPLCDTIKIDEFHQDQFRQYFRCTQCHLVFVPPQYYLSRQEEKAQYDSHQNSPNDPDYRAFLNRLFNPVQKRLAKTGQGLDFGCGPGPTLSVMFEEVGHTVTVYDPYYAPDISALDRTYDFITASEVVEHLSHPKQEFNRLWQCLKPGGYLGVMTKLVIDHAAFIQWHYKNEPTHIGFYSQETFQWLAKQWQARLEFFGSDVMIFTKKE